MSLSNNNPPKEGAMQECTFVCCGKHPIIMQYDENDNVLAIFAVNAKMTKEHFNSKFTSVPATFEDMNHFMIGHVLGIIGDNNDEDENYW